MAGSAELLQEYLVSIGYQVDAVSQKKLTDSLTATQKRILGVGTAVAGMVVAVDAAVTEFAYSMRKMYFDAQLAGSSVKGLQEMAFAGKQVGISAEAMARTMHEAGQAFRMPWMVNYASSLTHLNETGKKTEEILNDLMNSEAIKKNPVWIGQQIMSNFGMDNDTFFMWKTHMDEMKKSTTEFNKIYDEMGVDQNAGAKALADTAKQIDNTKERFNALTMQLAISFGPQVKAANSLIADSIDYWARWARGEETVLGTLKLVSAELLGLNDRANGMQGLNNKIGSLFGIDNLGDKLARWGDVDRWKKYFSGDSGSQSSSGKISGGSASSGGSRNERNNNPGNIKYGEFARSHGATGSDGTFAIFPNMAVGTKAMQDLLQHGKFYGGGGNDTISGIISKWAPQSDHNDTAAYIADVSKRMGVAAGIHLNLNDPTVLASLSRSIAGHEGMGSGAKITQTNTTTITVMGSGDPKATANAVAAAQSRVYGDNTRNMKGAFAT